MFAVGRVAIVNGVTAWFVAVLGVGLTAPACLLAQQLEAVATVTPSVVPLNGQFTLAVELRGTNRTDIEPSLPDMGDFSRYIGRNASTSMQMVNGITTVSLVIQYRFRAIREGTFEIGPVEVQAGGQAARTRPATLTVSDAAAAAGGQTGQQSASGIGTEDVFIVAEVSKTRVYQNEPIQVSYRLFTRVNVNSYTLVDLGESEGFWVEEVPGPQSPQVEQRVLGGQAYTTAVVRRAVLFPAGSGTKTIEPMSIEASVRVQRRSRDIFDDIFGGSSPFGSQVPVVIASNPVEVEVIPFPAEGRPRSFTGLVGRLDLSASIDRLSVETNDAVTFELIVAGEGNLRGLAEPVIEFPADFEVFPPEVTESIDRSGSRVRGTRTYEYVLIPRSPGERTIPPVEMSYFDGASALYASSASEPLRLEVTGDPVIAAPGGRAGVATLREDIRFIQIGPPSLGAIGGSLTDSAGFWIVALLPMVALMGALGLRRHWDRLEGDVAYARGRRAGRVAKKRLSQARAAMSESDARVFYAEVERALRGFLADKLNIAEAGFMSDTAEEELRERGVSVVAMKKYFACLGECDRARFAPPSSSAEERSEFFDRAASAMTAVQEGLS
ncbi:MAG TPA: protein BatD [Gemmatimonadetes bacterium]|nr:protein BatD [Gemmatimonadota bacterium]